MAAKRGLCCICQPKRHERSGGRAVDGCTVGGGVAVMATRAMFSFPSRTSGGCAWPLAETLVLEERWLESRLKERQLSGVSRWLGDCCWCLLGRGRRRGQR